MELLGEVGRILLTSASVGVGLRRSSQRDFATPSQVQEEISVSCRKTVKQGTEFVVEGFVKGQPAPVPVTVPARAFLGEDESRKESRSKGTQRQTIKDVCKKPTCPLSTRLPLVPFFFIRGTL